MTASPFRVGAQVKSFTLDRLLGQGGMGAVFLARDGSAGRSVALKVILAQQSEASLTRFTREAQVVANLRHPGIVGVHDAFVFQGAACIVYELVEGARTLQDAFQTSSLPERLRYVADVAEALAYVHAQGLIHRDVKPANVLVDPRGCARLTDFGLVRGEGLERLTQTGGLVGTPSYMAPEQAAGKRAEVGPHSDVWALGVLLYEALTGVLPFEGNNPMELLIRIASVEPAKPRAIAAGPLPEGVSEVCLEALAKEPRDRFPDAGAFQAALREALDGKRAAPIPWGRLAAGAALVVLGPLVWLSLSGREKVATDIAQQSAAPSSSPTPRTGRGWILRAEGLLREGRRDEALAALGRSIALEPDLLRARFLRGVLYQRCGEVELGLRDLEICLAARPDHGEAYYRVVVLRAALGRPLSEADLERPVQTQAGYSFRARALAHAGRYSEAIEDYDQVLAQAPNDAAARANRARARRALGDLLGACEDFRGAIRLGAGPDVETLLAELLIELRRLPEAEALLESALKSSPQHRSGLHVRANLRLQQGDLVRARADLERGLALEPKSIPSRLVLAELLTAEGDQEASLRTYKELLREAPADSRVLGNLAASYINTNRLAEAEALLRRALKTSPRSYVLRGNLATVCLRTERLEEALEWAEEAVDLAPGEIPPRHSLAEILQGLGRTEDALAHLARAEELAPQEGRTHFVRSKIMFQTQRYPEALAALDAAIEVAPQQNDYYRERGLQYARAERHQDALRDFDLVARREPSAEAYTARGFTRYQLQDVPGALGDLDRALKLDPKHLQALVNRVLILNELGRLPDAIPDLNALLAQDPNSSYERFLRAQAHFETKDFAQALADVEAYQRLEPGALPGALLRGRCLAALDRHQDALESFDGVLRLQPDQPNALAFKADSLWALERWPEVVETIDRLLPKLAPEQAKGVLQYRQRALGKLRAAQQKSKPDE